ncbi:MAG: OmpA family protein [Rhodocyclaceae bacterium]
MGRTTWIALFVAVVLATGCGHLTERVVLLPSASGHASSVVVRTAQGETRLADAYAAAEITDGKVVKSTIAEQDVRREYGEVLAAQPSRPRSFVVYFYFQTTQLRPESRVILEQVRREVATYSAPEVVVTGHTDRMGTDDFNDRLSVERARVVRDAILSVGIRAATLSVAGRGEREPMVPTRDEVAEPRNRRVEIKIR